MLGDHFSHYYSRRCLRFKLGVSPRCVSLHYHIVAPCHMFLWHSWDLTMPTTYALVIARTSTPSWPRPPPPTLPSRVVVGRFPLCSWPRSSPSVRCCVFRVHWNQPLRIRHRVRQYLLWENLLVYYCIVSAGGATSILLHVFLCRASRSHPRSSFTQSQGSWWYWVVLNAIKNLWRHDLHCYVYLYVFAMLLGHFYSFWCVPGGCRSRGGDLICA